MKSNEENDELIGSSCKGVVAERTPGLLRLICKLFKTFTREEQKLQIHNHGGPINVYLINYTKEEIEEMIMENNGTVKHQKLC